MNLQVSIEDDGCYIYADVNEHGEYSSLCIMACPVMDDEEAVCEEDCKKCPQTDKAKERAIMNKWDDALYAATMKAYAMLLDVK